MEFDRINILINIGTFSIGILIGGILAYFLVDHFFANKAKNRLLLANKEVEKMEKEAALKAKEELLRLRDGHEKDVREKQTN